MKPEIAKKWVEALRSGEFEQGKFQLNTGFSYCCLGVLCELHERDVGGEEWERSIRGLQYMGCLNDLPRAVQVWAGMQSACGKFLADGAPDTNARYLTTLNDGGTKFPEIASLIEQHTEAL